MLKDYFDLTLKNNELPQFSTIQDLIEYCQTNYADRVFLIDKGTEYTYAQIYTKIRGCSKIIQKRMQKTKDVVGVIAPDGVQLITAALAVMGTGYPCVLIPASLPAQA